VCHISRILTVNFQTKFFENHPNFHIFAKIQKFSVKRSLENEQYLFTKIVIQHEEDFFVSALLQSSFYFKFLFEGYVLNSNAREQKRGKYRKKLKRVILPKEFSIYNPCLK
jgi:hypothetical protein